MTHKPLDLTQTYVRPCAIVQEYCYNMNHTILYMTCNDVNHNNSE